VIHSRAYVLQRRSVQVSAFGKFASKHEPFVEVDGRDDPAALRRIWSRGCRTIRRYVDDGNPRSSDWVDARHRTVMPAATMSSTTVAAFWPSRGGRAARTPGSSVVSRRICGNRLREVAEKPLRIHQTNQMRQTSAADADRRPQVVVPQRVCRDERRSAESPKVGVGGHKWVGSSTITGALWSHANHTEIH